MPLATMTERAPASPHAKESTEHHLPVDLRWWKQAAAVIVATPVALYLAYGTALCAWRGMVAQPGPTQLTLASGVEYTRSVQSSPNRVWHVVTVDLLAEGLEVQGPQADPTLALPLRAMSATEAVLANQWTLGFGAGAFLPKAAEGEPLAPVGRAFARGVSLQPTAATPKSPVLVLRAGAPATLSAQPAGDGDTQIESLAELLSAGKVVASATDNDELPRLGVGLDGAGRTMYVAMVDGYLSKSSKGATALELAEKLKAAGAVNAAEFARDEAVGMAAVFPGTTAPAAVGTPVACGMPGHQPALGYVLGLKAAARL